MIAKSLHEIRDPIHVFIRLDSDERTVLDSQPVQRLRHIHQLALTSLVYPAATHRRFEHSLGVMELAGRVYDVVTNPDHVLEGERGLVPKPGTHNHTYWRRVVRLAALCHDIGHLPFSHAAEKELLPAGWDHERLTVELILNSNLAREFEKIKVQPKDVAKLAVGPKKYRDEPFDVWEAILSELIVGDAFGVDRMDYLLRDSHHAGVAYGRFDHFRLIDTLRILPKVGAPENARQSLPDGSVKPEPEATEELSAAEGEPTLGVEQGGLHSTEALLWARYFMYSQLYFHPVRRIYDIHLKEFLKQWLTGGRFSTDLQDHLCLTDNEVYAALLDAARDPSKPGHDPARRIVEHKHYKVLYQRNPDDLRTNPDAAKAIRDAAYGQFSDTDVHYDSYKEKGRALDFPVLTRDGRVVSGLTLSETLRRIDVVAVDYVFIKPELYRDADEWLHHNRPGIIAPKVEEQS
jgi:HD superfamily phosphohydrolase